LTLFNRIERHFLAKLPGEGDAIITDTSKVVNTMNSLCIEMDDRYDEEDVSEEDVSESSKSYSRRIHESTTQWFHSYY
jgi:S-DNA-T family DNA segregation ATPase FtsK/SpoIIIE